jgi:cellulose synthase/poly-beta-1,6-N-acetylglucosamine synthase-like glycosyltransferase
MTARATILITAHDAAETIEACLRAAAAQQGFDAGMLGIVLVDDRSRDGTAMRAASLGLPQLRILRVEDYRDERLTARQIALDFGIAAAPGDVVLTLDSDAIPEPSWATGLCAPIRTGRADVVAGGVAFVAPPHATSVQRIIADLQTTDAAYYLAACALLDAAGVESGLLFGSAAFTRAAYQRTGGFAAIGGALTEDLAFARAAKRTGAQLAFRPQSRVAVRASTSWRAVVERAARTSDGGTSALAAVIGIWMLLLPVLLVLAPWSGRAAAVLAVRYLAGVTFTGVALVRAGAARQWAMAFLYEPFAAAIGLWTLVRLRGVDEVEWGGVRYARRGAFRGSVES